MGVTLSAPTHTEKIPELDSVHQVKRADVQPTAGTKGTVEEAPVENTSVAMATIEEATVETVFKSSRGPKREVSLPNLTSSSTTKFKYNYFFSFFFIQLQTILLFCTFSTTCIEFVFQMYSRINNPDWNIITIVKKNELVSSFVLF